MARRSHGSRTDASFILIDHARQDLSRDGSLEEDTMETVEWHVGKMEAELRQWHARLDKLIAKADAAGTGAKIDYRNRLEDLREKYAVAEARLAELKAAGRSRWDTYKGGVDTAMSELAMAFTKVAN
jgi:hypothetical protein